MKASHLVSPAVLLLVWLLVSGTHAVSPLLLPGPFAVLEALKAQLFVQGDLWRHIGLTLYRTLFSLGLSCLIGIPLGVLMGFVPRVSKGMEFTVDFFRSIPPIALFPLFLLLFGIGEAAKIAVPFYGCVLVLVVNSAYGVSNVPQLRRIVGQVYGFSKMRIFFRIVVPDAMPQVFVGIRTAVSLALVLTIVVEMFFGSQNGLGKKIYDYHLRFDTAEMYAAVAITGLVGYSLNKGFVHLERRLIHWADK